MADVLLAHSYFLQHDPKQQSRMKPYAPLATLYAASVLREEGYAVALFDAMLSDGVAEFAEALREHQPRFVVLYEDSFNFLVMMCLVRMREAALSMAQLAANAEVTVIAAGPDVTDHPATYLSCGVSYALVGEADHTLVELLGYLTSGTGTASDKIPGLARADTSEPGGVRLTGERQPERRPDIFPSPHGISLMSSGTAPRGAMPTRPSA
ncbi:MAG: cobalamin-dependent protein [Capsulimonadaceae bacterium]